jgi:hypothetical protein
VHGSHGRADENQIGVLSVQADLLCEHAVSMRAKPPDDADVSRPLRPRLASYR